MANSTLLRSLQHRNVASLSGNGVMLHSTFNPIAKFIRTFRSTSEKDVIIGIDLGATNFRVAVMNGQYPEVIANSEGVRVTPSVVAFDKEGKVLVGTAAKNQLFANLPNTMVSTKLLFGRKFDEFRRLQRSLESRSLAYKLGKTPNDLDVCVQANGLQYSPCQIAAILLRETKKNAESYLWRPISKAVITVPAHFSSAQRKATKDACRIAGLDVARLISEPNAAALSYCFLKRPEGIMVVFCMGGGSFDVSILEISSFGTIEVRATKGAPLGGMDFDKGIVEFLVKQFKNSDGIDLSNITLAYERLREAAEKAKIELSSAYEANINLPFIISDNLGASHLNISVTRDQFEASVKFITEKIKNICLQCLEDAGITSNQVDEVIAAGGMTNVPMVQKMIYNLFGKNPSMEVNPDEAVVKGAAIQGGILCNDVFNLHLRDATPLILDMTNNNTGRLTCLIKKHTLIPFTESRELLASDSNQVSFRLHQSTSGFYYDNLLGEFETSCTPTTAHDKPEIKVTAHIDVDGIITVSAEEKETGKQLQICSKNTGGHSEQEIEKMMQVTDNERKIKAVNAIHDVEKSLEEYRNKVSRIVSELDSVMHNLHIELKGDDIEQIKNKLETANKAVVNIGKGLNESSEIFSDVLEVGNAVSYHEDLCSDYDDPDLDEYGIIDKDYDDNDDYIDDDTEDDSGDENTELHTNED